MGWMYVQHTGSVADKITELYTYKHNNYTLHPEKISVVGFNTAYAAIRYTSKAQHYIYAAVVLLIHRPKSIHNLGYKDMDETCFPVECNCPIPILNMLSPPEEFLDDQALVYAREWRRRCWQNIIDRRVKKLKRPSIVEDAKAIMKGFEHKVEAHATVARALLELGHTADQVRTLFPSVEL